VEPVGKTTMAEKLCQHFSFHTLHTYNVVLVRMTQETCGM
jgi:hypothetical protein